MTVRIRGIYTTALTALLDDVVDASGPIEERFAREFPVEPAAVSIETTADRQGLRVTGRPDSTTAVADELVDLGKDAFRWRADLPRGAVAAGEVTETLRGGALLDCGPASGFLPYSNVDDHVSTGDRLRVQVTEPRPPWDEGSPVLDTTISLESNLATLERGGTSQQSRGPDLLELLPVEPLDGWSARWTDRADEADLDALEATISGLNERAEALEDSLDESESPEELAPATLSTDERTVWVWFGRESRFALDEIRRDVTVTMPGHHRTKAGMAAASSAVDFLEAVVETNDNDDEQLLADFPFPAVTDSFGPHVDDSLDIGHGKPDGRRIELGPGTVTDVTEEGRITVRRELSGGGTYDALGVEKREGDVAITKCTEGRWWYPTVYRGADGDRRGTYVNVCTPVEIFPDEVRYIDLYIDVIKGPDGGVEVVDEDELSEAVADDVLSEALGEKAKAVAGAVERSL